MIGISTMRIFVSSFLFVVAGCGPGLESQISDAKTTLEDAENSLTEMERTCEAGTSAFVGSISERSLAEADAAIAEVNANAGPDQEWELRRSLGRELGLAPNEVNNWREVYRGRAEVAKRNFAQLSQIDQHQESVNKLQKEYACDELAGARTTVNENKRLLARLKAQR